MSRVARSLPHALALLLAFTGCAKRDDRAVSPVAGVQPPSVLLLTLDTTRADHLGAYGSRSGATPHLDALAARGVVFERAWAVAPLTLPAHTSMMTGELPARTGVRWNGEQRLAEGTGALPTLAERFRSAGYATGGFVSAAVLDHAFGLGRGFERYDDEITEAAPGVPSRDRFRSERAAAATLSRALTWLGEQPPGRPVFLWVHLFEPHDPYLPPPPFAERFPRDAYSAEIAAADDAAGKLLSHPRFAGSAAIVAVLGDHGEGLGDHGEATHGLLLTEAALHIPWIVAAPGVAPRRERALVSQIDLAPTLLDLAGLPATAGERGASAAAGRSLGALLRDATPAERNRTVYAESLYAQAIYGWAPLSAARRGDWKWVEGVRGELFDLASDPGERQDLRVRQPAEAAALARALGEIEEEIARAGGATARAAVDGELAEHLRSLGYLSGAATASPSEATDDPRDRIATHEQLRALDREWRQGDFDGAQANLARLFAADPRNRLLQRVVERQLAGVLKSSADAATRAALELQLATLALSDRRFEEARVHAASATALAPRDAAARSLLAVALDALGRLDEAEQAYRDALALDPSLYRAELNLARLLSARPGGRAEAAEHVRRFLASAPADDPHRAEARAALARLSADGRGGG